MFDVTAGTVRDLALGWSLGALLPPALLQPHARPALNEEPFYLPHCVAAVFVARIGLSTTFRLSFKLSSRNLRPLPSIYVV